MSAEPLLTVEPERFWPEADASAVIFSDNRFVYYDRNFRPARFETSLDLIMDEARVFKLWMEVDIYEIA